MKRLVILHLVGLLALALDFGEASTLVRRRSATKKSVEKNTIEKPFICINRTVSLPPCNFGGGDIDKKISRGKRSVDQLEPLMPIEPKTSSQRPVIEGGQSRGVMISYEIEGCMPARLPFTHPDCKEEDKEGRQVHVQKLRPFAPPSGLTGKPPLVFPKMNEDEQQQKIKDRQQELGPKEDISGLEKNFNKFLYPKRDVTGAEHDSKRFQVTRPGSVFPYGSAISYDAKKLEDRREKTRRDAASIQ